MRTRAQSGRVTQRCHNSPGWETGVTECGWRHAPEARGGFWEILKKSVSRVETCLWRRRLAFACSRRPCNLSIPCVQLIFSKLSSVKHGTIIKKAFSNEKTRKTCNWLWSVCSICKLFLYVQFSNSNANKIRIAFNLIFLFLICLSVYLVSSLKWSIPFIWTYSSIAATPISLNISWTF